MKQQARQLERTVVEGKVFKGGATWKKLEKFFEKSRETILEDLSEVATPEEVNFIVEQIEANEYYQENVRVIDPEYLADRENISALFALNSKLCTISEAENKEVAKELKDLKYLLIFSHSTDDLASTKYGSNAALSKKEQQLFAAYDYFDCRGKKVLLMTHDKNTLMRAAEYGINAASFAEI